MKPSGEYDIAIIGAGAAGLMAAICSGRTARGLRSVGEPGRSPIRVIALDGAKKLGAKILVAGGGRCNVTHHHVDESAYAGSSRKAIAKVLRSFDVPRTVEFFRELGVELKQEETGKLFPTTDDAHTVLNALLMAASEVGVEIRHPWRVAGVRRDEDGFVIERAAPTPTGVVGASGTASASNTASTGGAAASDSGESSGGAAGAAAGGVVAEPEVLRAKRVILATGGMALPRSGSDGAGYAFARGLGHTVTPRVFPALVPLVLPEGSFIRGLSGLTLDATLWVRGTTGKKLAEFTNSTLCTHFGLSGPGPLDISRYFFDARHQDPGAELLINWLPRFDAAKMDETLQSARGTGLNMVRVLTHAKVGLPERLARALMDFAGVPPLLTPDDLPKERRRALVQAITQMVLPVMGDRGFTYAEVTAGGVPLTELHLDSMSSRATPGLHVIGEICDVDGRIGGFNFQWAWASGYVAGCAAARAAMGEATHQPADELPSGP